MKKSTPAAKIAFGGIMAALALVIMNMVGLIPVATYVCPAFCMIILSLVVKLCGNRIGWAWYGAVAILNILLAPDKEASAIFLVLGYYPIIKPAMEKLLLDRLLKAVYFNCVILAMYWLMIHLLGFGELGAEFSELGKAFTVVLLLMGNLIFFMLDRILSKIATTNKWGRK